MKRRHAVLLATVALAIPVSAAVAVMRYLAAQQLPLPTPAAMAGANAWEPLGGDWVSNATETQNNSQERGGKLLTQLGAWTDYAMDADVRIVEPFGGAGMIVRSSGEAEGADAYHGYYAGIRTMDASFEFGRADYGWHSLVHRSLPAGADLQGWMHLRIVAIGCSFGVLVTVPDGRQTAATVQDPQCLGSGRFGLRSYLTSASWRNVHLSLADAAEIATIAKIAQTSPEANVPTAGPFGPAVLSQYSSAILAEAKKHQLGPGAKPIMEFHMSPGSHPNVTIQGVIISTPPLTAVEDDSGALILPDIDPRTPIKLGDVVEAEGTLVSERFRSELNHAKIKVLWSDTEIPPLAVTAAQLTSGTYRGRTIEVEGILRSMHITAGGYDLVLQDGGQLFRAVGAKNYLLSPLRLQVGSRLRVRGMATSLSEFTNGIYSFAVITTRVETVAPPPWWSPRHILLLAIACISLFLLAQFLLHQLQRWHIRSMLKERERLAFDMHDTLAQSFTGIAYQLQAANAERRGEAMMKEHLRTALEMVKISHREASNTIAALRPQYRDAAEIVSALRECADRLSDGGLQIETALQGKLTELPLEVTDVLFRIGEEAISNAIQHSQCDLISIRLSLSRQAAELSVVDNGQGFDKDAVAAGMGLESMRRRAAKIKASFALTTQPAAGTSVTVTATLKATRSWMYRLRAKLLSISIPQTPG